MAKKATKTDEEPERRATLSDRQARGGVIGGKGYGFQAAYIVSRIPRWLGDPDFVQFLQEGAGDVDVRFNRADGEKRWYVQVKNYSVKPPRAREVLTQFRDTDAGTPGTYTRFILACPGLHDNLKSLRAAVDDFRGAAPFYRPGQDPIVDNTRADLGEQVRKLKLPVGAAFLVNKVHFDTDLAGLTDDTSLCDLFVGRLLKLEPWAGATYAAAAHAYEKLALRAHREIRRTCERDQIEATIRDAVEELPTRQAQPEGIPSPPTPYLAYRYPMPEHWTGRQDEMDELDAWLEESDGASMCCLIAIGGMGKSSLAWAWLRRRAMARQEALGLSGIFQWSFYEGEVSFRRFLEDLSAYLGVSIGSDPVTALTQRLAEERILLILDGFERLLCAYASADAALLPERTAEELEVGERRCIDWTTARFLRALVADTASKTLLASRLVPQELDRLAGWQLMELRGLAPNDAVAYLRTSGIKGTRRELQDASGAYGYHPLSLSKLVEVLHYDVRQPDDVRQAPRYDVTRDLKARQNHILKQAYETLPPELAQFLSALAALRGKVTMGTVQFLAGGWSEIELSANLRRLEDDRWITWEREQQMLDFHPVVRRYAYDRLADKPGTHTRLRDYFAAVPQPKRVERLDDLAPTIELYHHTVGAGRYDEAWQLFYARLNEPLYYRFGAYGTFIELQSAFFADGDIERPLLKDEDRIAKLLGDSANCYSLSGQPGRAVPLCEAHNALREKAEDQRNLAMGLVNLACMAQIYIGALAAAEENLRRSIALSREIEDEFLEAAGHQELGRVLAYTGAFEQAGRELEMAQKVFDSQGVTNLVSVVRATRALRALLMGQAGQESEGPLAPARRARELADEVARTRHPYERDFVRAEWLLGAAHRARRELAQAEPHLAEALRRCRRINLVESEPDILLELARLRYAEVSGFTSQVSSSGEEQAATLKPETLKPQVDEALSLAREALEIADRCEYRLVQADCHNFLAQLALEAGDLAEARQHAETARERAWCDGPPHRYEVAYQEAERLLGEIESLNHE